jgi:hypothetical protein
LVGVASADYSCGPAAGKPATCSEQAVTHKVKQRQGQLPVLIVELRRRVGEGQPSSIACK